MRETPHRQTPADRQMKCSGLRDRFGLDPCADLLELRGTIPVQFQDLTMVLHEHSC